MFGYSLCETGIGILAGVSNLFSVDNSGLYILKDDSKLINIYIEEPISHVQFIANNRGVISLYGNNYSHLYSFNIFTLEEYKGRLKTSITEKVFFSNDFFISQFVLSSDRKTALIRTDENNIYFYQNLYGNGFSPLEFDRDKFNPNDKFSMIVKGEYEEGNYNAYYLIKENNIGQVVMENKSSHKLVINNVENGIIEDEDLIGVTFNNNSFTFIYKALQDEIIEYRVRKGHILFDSIYYNRNLTNGESYLLYSSNNNDLVKQNLKILNTKLDTIYFGIGSELTHPDLYKFAKSYPSLGKINFTYHNNDIEGVSGFSFEVDRIWLNSDRLVFG
jgi:hypothetical protein